MSKILGINDVGFGILIENDAGYISHDFNKSLFINESKIKNFEVGEPILIECILQKWGVKNKNGRIYPKDILIAQSKAYEEIIKNNSAVSEVNHPDSTNISLLNISHLITKIWWGNGADENVLYGELKLIVSPGFLKYGIVSVVGDMILLYIQNKIKIGISSRGVGSLKDVNGEKIVQNDFELVAFDLVATPSTPGAYLNTDKLFSSGGDKNINNQSINENNSKILSKLNNFLEIL